jgi:hypothetical protein
LRPWGAGGRSREGEKQGAYPNVILARLLKHDALVFGRPSGFLSRVIDESTRVGDHGAFELDGVLVQDSNRGIALRFIPPGPKTFSSIPEQNANCL